MMESTGTEVATRRPSPWTPLRKFWLDLVPVVAGILIALAVDEWAQDRREQAQVQRILQGIARDYVQVQASTERLLPKHQQLVEALQQASEVDSLSAIDVIQRQGGIQFPSVRRPSDLELLGPEGRKHLSYELIAVVGQLEQAFRELGERESTLQQLAYNPRTLERGPLARHTKLAIAILMGDQIGTEEAVLKHVAAFRLLAAPHLSAADTVVATPNP